MKANIIIFFIGLSILSPVKFFSQILAQSAVSEAEIYRNGYARIFTQSEVLLRKGVHSVTVLLYGHNFLQQTIMAEISPKGSVLRIDEPKSIECHEDDSCQFYQQQTKSIFRTIQIKKLELEKLESHEKILMENARITSSSTLNLNLLRESIAFIHKQIIDVKDSKSKIKFQLEELQQKHDSLQNLLNQRIHYLRMYIRKMTVLVEVPSDLRYELRLSYTTTNVYWNREQEADFEETASVVYLRNIAYVKTDFREVWTNMRLTLIDKDFEFSTRPLEIKPLRVMFQSIPTYRNKVQIIQGQPSRAGTHILASESDMADGREEFFVERGQSADARIFILSGKYTLTHDKPLRAELYTDTLPIQIRYILAPYMSNKAQLLGVIRQSLESVSPTPSLVRLNGRPVGISTIPSIYDGDSAAFHLGFINDILVARKRDNPFSSQSLLGGSRKDLYEYTIQITSVRSASVDLTLVDRIPVSTDNQIDVKFKGATAEAKPDHNGILMWNLTVASGQTQTIRFAFEVTYPKNTRITFTDKVE
ncbi:MAG: DUF4139 domain-containing protein [Thermaurantimonas sp.]